MPFRGAVAAFVLWLAVKGLVVFAHFRGGGSSHPPQPRLAPQITAG
jgi:hypothetical protein